ncbi:MAG: hypothetical protein JXM79_16040 [Sedimentisphaerales bacterium]|nr:hypothetical protein [Sedimentisphaerales bacterium]
MTRKALRSSMDADRLAEGFLIAEHIWDPNDKEGCSDEPMHPELMRYLVCNAFERGDFTLRFWRENFYHWTNGRYRPVSTSESCHGLDEMAETMLKSYTAGDRIKFQRKFREPVDAVPTAKIMISTNQLPQFADKSYGIWRRLLFVPFEKTIDESRQNPNLIEALGAELPGVFNWALAGLKSLEKAGRFTMPQRCRDAVADYRRDVNPARAFLLDNYVASLDYDGLPTQEVYESYVRWCGRNGYRPMNAANFGKEVKRTLNGVKQERIRDRGRRIRMYQGMAVKEGSEVATEPYETVQAVPGGHRNVSY